MRGADAGGVEWIDEPVRVVPYDPEWPARFERERDVLEEAIGFWAVGGIHHVGSTAVPGLEAKPVTYLPNEMHWFCKPHPSRRTHHLHLVPVDTGRYEEELAFRDHLRATPAAAREYAGLKRELVDRFGDDREAYTNAKEAFIRSILNIVRA